MTIHNVRNILANTTKFTLATGYVLLKCKLTVMVWLSFFHA